MEEAVGDVHDRLLHPKILPHVDGQWLDFDLALHFRVAAGGCLVGKAHH